MRTSSDVIHRIQWDTVIDADAVSVGYLDRFEGVIERPFTMFNWIDDPALADDTHQIVIPQHRVQHFKYKHNFVLWDKKTRIDNVFGSTGGMQLQPFLVQCHENMKQADATVFLRFTIVPTRDVEGCSDDEVAITSVVTTEDFRENLEAAIRSSMAMGVRSAFRADRLTVHCKEKSDVNVSCEMDQAVIAVTFSHGDPFAADLADSLTSAINNLNGDLSLTGKTVDTHELEQLLCQRGLRVQCKSQ